MGSPGYTVLPLHPSSHICKARDSGHCFIKVLKGQVSDLPDFDACAPGKMDTGTKATIFALFQGVARPQADRPRISSKGSEVSASGRKCSWRSGDDWEEFRDKVGWKEVQK